ncbi:WD40 repeat-like protein, partial [Paxillus ammoniavirescens]
IWDAETGEQEGTSMEHKGRVYGLAVTRDGKRILSGGLDQRIKVWDVETHEIINEEWRSHTDWILCIAMSPDDQLAASGDCSGKLLIRETKESGLGEIKHSIGAGRPVRSLCFSPNGEKLACAVGDFVGKPGVIHVYDVDSGKLVLGPIKGHKDIVSCLLWSLDGSQLFSASYDCTIRCWNSNTGESIGDPWKGHTDEVYSLSLSPDGTKIVSASYDKTVRFWYACSGDPIDQPVQHDHGLHAVTFSPSSEFVASGGDDKVFVWRVPWWDDTRKQVILVAAAMDADSSTGSVVKTPAAFKQPITDTPWNLADIRSNFAHDITGYVVRDGEEPFAFGSFGDIYRGKLRLNGNSIDVAIKAIRTYSADGDDDHAQRDKRIRRELRTWVNLEHINVLPLFGTTMNFGRFPAMVCPWLENGSLTSYLERRNDTLTTAEILALLGDAAAGLQYLHSQSVVHGDLSGSNVLIGGNGRACISDFGLSILLTQLGGSTYATSRRAEGTLRWSAPELLDLEVPADEVHVFPTFQTDVYSFGSLMLQVLTGKVPYHYYIRDAQVLSAVSRGIIPQRPNRALVTDRQWMFMQRCWMPVGVGEPRPSDDEIVEFVRQELVRLENATS